MGCSWEHLRMLSFARSNRWQSTARPQRRYRQWCLDLKFIGIWHSLVPLDAPLHCTFNWWIWQMSYLNFPKYLAFMSLVRKDLPTCDEEQWLFELLSSHRSASRLQSDCSVMSGGNKNWTPVIDMRINRIGFFNLAFVISNMSISIQGRSSPVSLDKVNRWQMLEL